MDEREDKIFSNIYEAVLAYSDARSLLTPEESELLDRYDQTIKQLYPDGVPKDQEEEIYEAISKSEEFIGIDEIIHKLLSTSDLLMASKSTHKKQ